MNIQKYLPLIAKIINAQRDLVNDLVDDVQVNKNNELCKNVIESKNIDSYIKIIKIFKEKTDKLIAKNNDDINVENINNIIKKVNHILANDKKIKIEQDNSDLNSLFDLFFELIKEYDVKINDKNSKKRNEKETSLDVSDMKIIIQKYLDYYQPNSYEIKDPVASPNGKKFNCEKITEDEIGCPIIYSLFVTKNQLLCIVSLKKKLEK